MSAESTESIIDLLYGELSEEEASEVRADLQSSPQLQAEHDELERMLGRVREVMPTEEVSPTIHASILDAARAGVASQERVPRRVAEPAKRHRFWARLAGGQGAQLALVATVLIAGAFIAYLTDQSSTPLTSPAGNPSMMQEAAAPPVLVAEPTSAPEVAPQAAPEPDLPAPAMPEAEGALEVRRPTASPRSAPAAPTSDEQARIDASLRNELSRTRARSTDALGDRSDGPPAQQASVADKPTAAPKKSTAPAPKPRKKAAVKTSAKRKSSVDLFAGGASDAAAPRPQAEAAPAAQAATEDRAIEAEAEAPPEAKAETAAPPRDAAPLSAVHDHYSRSDYPGTIRAANNFLSANPDAPPNDRASAMQIKAQALTQSARYDEADQVYRQIQANYPGYQSGAIRQAREDLDRRNTRRKSPAPKALDLEADYESATE